MTASNSRHGIHHVTAIAGPAQRNLAFYTRTLGLRFVKKTVNFDDPGTYHFYFGDETGSPGTVFGASASPALKSTASPSASEQSEPGGSLVAAV